MNPQAPIKEKLEQQILLLEKERRYQQESFRSLLEQKPIKTRVQDGFTWYPVRIKGSGYAIGEIPFIELEKTNTEAGEDQFQAGRPIQIFTMQEHVSEKPVRGIIHWISKGSMKIFLHTDEVPDWISSGKIGVDLLYDEQTFRDMRQAFQQILNADPRHRLFRLASIFYGDVPPSSPTPQLSYASDLLNPSQIAAVEHALNSEDIAVIHGPPGTGKTTTLIHLIRELVRMGEQVLVCAPSNAAVDWITVLLADAGTKVLRMGHLSRMDNRVLDCSLESLVFSKPDAKNIKKIRVQADEYRKLASQYKRSFGPAERAQRKRLYAEARDLSEWAKELENRLVDEVLDQAQVITATLTGTNNSYLKGRTFRTCIIDEAAQALQGACWIAMSKADRVILAGDPFQLPPTVKDPVAAREGLSVTLLDIAVSDFPDIKLLQVQYRMNSAIMEFSNQWFYQGLLKAHGSVAGHALSARESSEQVLEFVDTAGCGFDEKQHPDTLSYYNKDEYLILREHLDPLALKHYADAPSVGILSPYKAQVLFIREQFEEEKELTYELTIQTIDAFQGQERDVIYISLVRSNDEGQIGFLRDYRRMNVAMTRARKKLIIIGDSSTVGNDPFYKALLDYCDSIGAYRSAWEFIS